jgi:flavin-dependent dehydrogenase
MKSTHQPAESRPRAADVDVVVVGARCAGAATALLLARAGHRVLMLDRAGFPSDTISTHVMARTGMVQLQRWGLLDEVVGSGAPPLRTVEFHTSEAVTTRLVKDSHGVNFLLAPRRMVLDDLLQQAALDAGARIWTRTAVDGVLRDGAGRVVGVTAQDDAGPVRITAKHVVGADGLASRVARWVGASVLASGASSGAAQYAYFAGDWPAIEYHLGDQAFSGVFPTHGGEACVWVCLPAQRARRQRRLGLPADEAFAALVAEVAPSLSARLRGARQTSPVRGMLRMPNYLRNPVGPGWALVGDAGYHRDAMTGLGISDAFRDADLLAEALDTALRDPSREGEALTAYHRERDRMTKRLFELTCELTLFPPGARFEALQKELARATDAQAEELAARPPLRAATVAA